MRLEILGRSEEENGLIQLPIPVEHIAESMEAWEPAGRLLQWSRCNRDGGWYQDGSDEVDGKKRLHSR